MVEPTRRDMLFIATGAAAAVAGAGAAWPLINQMNPDASTLSLASIEVDLGPIAVGQTVTVKWRGKAVFISHRTPKEIAEVNDPAGPRQLDPQADKDRTKKPEWLIVVGVCTHLGCIPKLNAGEDGGWTCACHGSQYDASGRVTRGPAPRNLEVPVYKFETDTKVQIG